jgi:hypothetical protein
MTKNTALGFSNKGLVKDGFENQIPNNLISYPWTHY